jgi:CubicO group peptidase (beta-lactamase class C family)
MQSQKQIDDVLQRGVEANAAAGAVAIAANDKGDIYQGAFGRREFGKDAPMTLDTVFWIASMTKALTSAAAMQLVEQGKLALDEPIGKVLPDLAAPQVHETDASGASKLRPAKRPITLRHLLTHTAGFCYEIWNGEVGKYMEQAGIPSIISCQHAALTAPLASDPGTRWEYGLNIDFVGKAVEAISGKTLEAYLRDHLFAPLGMKDTGFILDAGRRARLAAMHARLPDGGLTPIPFEFNQEPEFHVGGAGLYGTAPDYIRFLRMLLNGGTLNGNQVLKAETVKLMSQNHIGDLQVTPLKTAMPQYSSDVEMWPGMEKKWGLSFIINTQKTPQGRSAGSLAWAGLANTYFWLDPKENVAGVILTQVLPFGDAKAYGLFQEFESEVYRSRGPAKQAA